MRKLRGAPAAVSLLAIVVLAMQASDPRGRDLDVGARLSRATWHSSFERGDLSEWSWYFKHEPQNYPPVKVIDASSAHVTYLDGRKVARFRMTKRFAAQGRIHSKVYKWWKRPKDVSGTYSAYYWLPRTYKQRTQRVNVFQFKEEWRDRKGWHQEAFQWIDLAPLGRKPHPHAPVALARRARGRWKMTKVPRGRWFEIRAEVHQGERIEYYVDGKHFDTISHRLQRVGPRRGADKWIFGVGNYGANRGRIYVDAASFTRR